MAIPGLSRWRPRHLLGAWSAWWAGLAAATLGPAARAVWHVTHLPEGQGSASLSFEDGILTLVTSAGGFPAYTGTASLLGIGLWIAGPPLLLWAAWLASRPRRADAPDDAATEREAREPQALHAPDSLEARMRRDLDARANATAGEREPRSESGTP